MTDLFLLNLLPPVGVVLDLEHYQDSKYMYKYTVCTIETSTQQK